MPAVHEGRLRVAAATTVGDKGFDRSQALIEAGVDCVVIDTAHGHNVEVSRAVERVKALSNRVQVIAGNVEVSQGVTNCLLGALCILSASQGTMNNRLR